MWFTDLRSLAPLRFRGQGEQLFDLRSEMSLFSPNILVHQILVAATSHAKPGGDVQRM